MKKGWALVSILFIIIIIGLLVLVLMPAPTKAPTQSESATTTPATTEATTTPAQSSLSDTITVDSPASNAVLTSPVTISGKARGTWYFEASAPVKLLDSNSNILAQGTIVASGNWMTTDFVPFTGKLTFTAPPAGTTGTLVLTNDNPSGDPAKQKTLTIPVKF